ncbi:MAG TPA: hypothetical protein VGB17_19490 [Pyrinomonadaceae bacterium]|jgi:hypothetical protein
MKRWRLGSAGVCALLVLLSFSAQGQQPAKNRTLVCRREVLAALKPLPRLEYRCRPDAPNDYDEKILKWPERLAAIGEYVKRLEGLTGREWWEQEVEDLNVCYFRGKAGALSIEEKEKFETGDYQINLWGNHRIRLVVAPDPCFQTGYNGSNAFLLYRENGKARATQILDGYFSRAENSVWLDFASSGPEEIIEVSTSTGGLSPYITNYYFVIDGKTRRAVPKNLFRAGRRLTNRITSAMLLGEFADAEGRYAEMRIIRRHRLARTFNIYEEDPEGQPNDNGRALKRRVYRWNGRVYVKAR